MKPGRTIRARDHIEPNVLAAAPAELRELALAAERTIELSITGAPVDGTLPACITLRPNDAARALEQRLAPPAA